MGNEFQNALDHDNLAEDRCGLKGATEKLYKKRFEREIKMENNNYLDEIHMGFICENPDLDFEKLQIVKKVFDYMKGVK